MPSGPDLFVGAANGNSVRRYDGRTGALLDDFTKGGPSLGHSCPAFGPDANLYVAEWSGNAVRRYHGGTGALLGTVIPGAHGGIATILFGPVGALYAVVPHVAPYRIDRYDVLASKYLGT